MTNPRVSRRGLRTWLVAIVSLLVAALVVAGAPGEARAGSYLDRAAVLLNGSKHDMEMLRSRLTDKELATVIQQIADTRVRAASHMEVPAAIAKAHPHLLLALEHAERAAAAALEGSLKVAFEKLEASRREDEAFRALCKEMNMTVPGEGPQPPRAR